MYEELKKYLEKEYELVCKGYDDSVEDRRERGVFHYGGAKFAYERVLKEIERLEEKERAQA